jgi:hypothetical protein
MAFIFQKVGRSKAEIFKVLKNGSAAAITPGDAVVYDYTTAKDGYSVILPTTALLTAFAGVVAVGTTLAISGSDGEYGKVQIYGHHAAIRVAGTTVIPGSPLVPVNATGAMKLGVTHAASTTEAQDMNLHFAFAGTSQYIANSLYSAVVGFVRAM